MLDAALAAGWFALAVLSCLGACYALVLVLDGMRSAWALIIALMAAATLATAQAGKMLERVMW